MTMAVLLVALEDGRWGPARLAQEFAALGANVVALAPAGNAVLASSHLGSRILLADAKSSRSFRVALKRAMEGFAPRLIIPCDEQAVVALHHQLRLGRLPARHSTVLQASLGTSGDLDTLLMKDKCLDLARSLGIPVPPGLTVTSPEEAAKAGEALGFPVYVKSSFSWAGFGTISCVNGAQAERAYQKLAPRQTFGLARTLAKKVMARAWYPISSPIQLQKPVPGVPAMFCAAAWKGRYLGGFAGLATATSGATGPSTRVQIGPNALFETYSAALIGATGASGLLGFDYMWDPVVQQATLLECNPRPIQICHLGESVGTNLCALLLAAVAQEYPVYHAAASQTREVTLFPQAWFAGQGTGTSGRSPLDVPYGDKGLWQFMLEAGARRGLQPPRPAVAREAHAQHSGKK